MSFATPPCPVCEAPTVRRTARQGPYRGDDFWGCSRFPETGCEGKINIPSENPAPQAPGASAQARFERERAIYHAKVRALLPLLTALTVIVMAIVFLALVSFNLLFAVVAMAAAGVMGAYFVARLPTEALTWGRGAKGEKKTAEYLGPLCDQGFVILHDRWIPGGRGNIDHIAIGPSGVYVIETKNLSGSIEITNDRLLVSSRDRQRYVDEVYREAIATQIALGELLNQLRVTVTPVLCIHGARTPFDKRAAGVRVIRGQDLRKLV